MGNICINIYESIEWNFKKLIPITSDNRAKSSYREMSKAVEHTGVCVVMGSEDVGISRGLKNSCDIMCSIPIHGSVACLNISVACGVILYEVAKYR